MQSHSLLGLGGVALLIVFLWQPFLTLRRLRLFKDQIVDHPLLWMTNTKRIPPSAPAELAALTGHYYSNCEGEYGDGFFFRV